MNTTRRLALLALLVAGNSTTFALPKKTAAKPAAKPQPKLIREVMGTTQLTGYEGALNQTFTLGKDMPFNFTLKSVAYSMGRVNIDEQAITPEGDEKLLVVHFTAQNPTPKTFFFNSNYLTFIAVDANGVSHKYGGYAAYQATGKSLGQPLNPGQKIEAYTVVRVPDSGVVPKLIVSNTYEAKAPIVRYDLRNMAKKLVPPYVEASDKSGANALKTVAATSGAWYPVTDFFDARLEKIDYSTEKAGGRAPDAGKKYCFATFTIRNGGKRSMNVSQSYFRTELKDADGEKTNYNQSMLKASRDEESGPQLAPGEEARVRFYWSIPENVTAKNVLFQYGYDKEARIFSFAVPN